MSIYFKAENHQYASTPEENVDLEWISSTGVVGALKEKFDAAVQAPKSAKNKKSKWHGMTPEAIIAAWDKESKRATDLGTWYHDMRERAILDFKHLEVKGNILEVFRPEIRDGIKYAPDQKLKPGIYPELMVYLKKLGFVGQVDRAVVHPSRIVDIDDFKTSKEIARASYVNWEGVSKKMKAPVAHLDDCHFYHYALQMSLYMYAVIKNNPTLIPGELTIHHVKFEESGRDQFDYPITLLDSNGEPVVKDIEYIKVPYLKGECIKIFDDMRKNRTKYEKPKPILQ